MPFLEDLFEATHENVQLAVRDDAEVVYIERIAGRSAVGVDAGRRALAAARHRRRARPARAQPDRLPGRVPRLAADGVHRVHRHRSAAPAPDARRVPHAAARSVTARSPTTRSRSPPRYAAAARRRRRIRLRRRARRDGVRPNALVPAVRIAGAGISRALGWQPPTGLPPDGSPLSGGTPERCDADAPHHQHRCLLRRPPTDAPSPRTPHGHTLRPRPVVRRRLRRRGRPRASWPAPSAASRSSSTAPRRTAASSPWPTAACTAASRCPQSRLDGDTIVCGYHGFTYDTAGDLRRRAGPDTASRAPRASPSYPVVGAGLVRLGVDRRPGARPTRPGSRARRGWPTPDCVDRRRHGAARLRLRPAGRQPAGPLARDLPARRLHRHAEVAETPITTEVDDEAGIVRVARHMLDAACPPFYAKSTGIEGRITRLQDIEYFAAVPVPPAQPHNARSASRPRCSAPRSPTRSRRPRRARCTTSGPSPGTSPSTTPRSREFLRDFNHRGDAGRRRAEHAAEGPRRRTGRLPGTQHRHRRRRPRRPPDPCAAGRPVSQEPEPTYSLVISDRQDEADGVVSLTLGTRTARHCRPGSPARMWTCCSATVWSASTRCARDPADIAS